MSNSIEYQDAIVSYFDILGFSDFITSEGKTPQEIYDILNAVSSKYIKQQRAFPLINTHFYTMSDSLVEITIVDKPDGAFYYALLNAVYWAMHFIDYGVFLRGGITYGKLFFDPNKMHLTFGPSLIKAVRIEQKDAVNPRIVIDDALLKMIEIDPKTRGLVNPSLGSHNKPQDEHDYIYNLLAHDEWDDCHYVDYLGASSSEFSFALDYYLTFLPNHKKLIEDNIKKFNELGDKHTLKKYIWLKNYHNNCVSKIPSDRFSMFYFNEVGENFYEDIQEVLLIR